MRYSEKQADRYRNIEKQKRHRLYTMVYLWLISFTITTAVLLYEVPRAQEYLEVYSSLPKGFVKNLFGKWFSLHLLVGIIWFTINEMICGADCKILRYITLRKGINKDIRCGCGYKTKVREWEFDYHTNDYKYLPSIHYCHHWYKECPHCGSYICDENEDNRKAYKMSRGDKLWVVVIILLKVGLILFLLFGLPFLTAFVIAM
jgi:hypothetical protein